jgi:hypothetical protein
MPAKFLGIWIWLRLKAYENRIDEETTVKLKSLLPESVLSSARTRSASPSA